MEGHQVVHAALGHRCLEALIVADDPGRQIPAIRAAGDRQPVRIGQPMLHQDIDPGEHIHHRPVAPIADVGLHEGIIVAARAARIAEEHHIPAGGMVLPLQPHRRRAGAPHPLRAAVNVHRQRIAPALLVVRRPDEPAVNRRAVGAGVVQRFHRRDPD